MAEQTDECPDLVEGDVEKIPVTVITGMLGEGGAVHLVCEPHWIHVCCSLTICCRVRKDNSLELYP